MIATTSTEIDRLARRIGLHVRAGRFILARQILDEAAREAAATGDVRERQPGGGFVGVPLSAAGVPQIAVQILAGHGIDTVADVDARSDAELRALPGIGLGRLAVLRRCCNGV